MKIVHVVYTLFPKFFLIVSNLLIKKDRTNSLLQIFSFLQRDFRQKLKICCTFQTFVHVHVYTFLFKPNYENLLITINFGEIKTKLELKIL